MILAALNDYYDRLIGDGKSAISPFGYSQERISYALVLDGSGQPVAVKDLRITDGRKTKPTVMPVPKFEQRTSGVHSYFLWEKTSYLFGVATKDDRVLVEHDAFRKLHIEALSKHVEVEELLAVVRFLDLWEPSQFKQLPIFNEEMLDQNFVLQLDGLKHYIHENEAVPDIWNAIRAVDMPPEGTCLVTGSVGPLARVHPPIKGVDGANTTGTPLVSFTQVAATSYCKDQGGNAPVSELAAFGYSTALNHLLRRDANNRNRLQLGDTTAVFWAEAPTAEQATAGESLFDLMLRAPDSPGESQRLKSTLVAIAQGKPIQNLEMNLHPDTKIYVLGLSPNAARLSVRFWETARLESFAKRLADHYQDLHLQPLPWHLEPSIRRLLAEVVPHRKGSKAIPKAEDAPPHLAGEVTRAILTGRHYPRSLLANLIMRMRADGDISDLRVALCKAVLVRDARIRNHSNEDTLVSLDTENRDPGYLLGRLFASLESTQRAALGRSINATIRDRYYGAASATPASVFPVLVRNAQNHLGKVRKEKPGLAVNLEKQISGIVDCIDSSFPKSLGLEAQGRFAIGYYHQIREVFRKHEKEIENDEGEEA